MVRLSTTEFRGKVRLLHSTGKFKGIHNCKRLYETLVNQCGTARLKDELLATLDKLDEYESLRYPNINAPTEVGNDDWSAIEAFVEYVYRAMPKELLTEREAVRTITKAGRILMRKKIVQTATKES